MVGCEIHLQLGPNKDLKNGTNWILSNHSAFQGKGMGRETAGVWKSHYRFYTQEGRCKGKLYSLSLTLYTEFQRLANNECCSFYMSCYSWMTVFNAQPCRTYSQNWEDIKLPNNFIFLLFVKKLAKICSCQNQFSPIWVSAVKLLFIKYSPILKLRKKLPWKSPTYLQSYKTVVNCFSSNMYISFFLIKQ